MADLPSVPLTQSQPFSLNQGLGSISSLLDIQRQQQALQTGQYQQASAQANSEQDQQKSGELQAAQNVALKGANTGKYTNPDGTLNRQKMADDISTVAPTYGQTVSNQLLSGANEVVKNKQAIQDLTDSQRKAIGSTMQSLAADPNVDSSKVIDAVESLRNQYNDPSFSRLLTSTMMHLPPGADAKTLQQTLGTMASSMTQSAPVAPSTIDTGATIQPGATNRYTGAFRPAGTAIQKTIAPGLEKTLGGIATVGPHGELRTAPTVGGPPSAAASPGKLQPIPSPGLNPNPVAQANYEKTIADSGQHVRDVSAAANDPQNGIGASRYRNDQILSLVDNAKTGPGMGMFNYIASKIPGDSGDSFQKVGHFLAQNSAAMAGKMGVPSTNMGAETAAAAAGNVNQNPGAIKEITKVNDALNTAFDLYNRGLSKASANGADPSKVPAFRQAFGQNFDVNVFRYNDAIRRGDKAEVDRITNSFGPKGSQAQVQGLQQLGAKRKVLESLANTGDLP